MASDALDESPPDPVLTLGRLDQVRVQVGYRVRPDGPADQQFLLDLPVAERGPAATPVLDDQRLLTALEPVLYVGSDVPRHYSLHQHRWHSSWGLSPGALEVGLHVTTGRVTGASHEGVLSAFRELIRFVGGPVSSPVSRDAAIVRARSSVATAYPSVAEELVLSEEEHDPVGNRWRVGLRTTRGDQYDVVVGFVDGYAGAVWVRHGRSVEVFDSVGSE
jgi:hypothetical protein